jgi:hypothetical protein
MYLIMRRIAGGVACRAPGLETDGAADTWAASCVPRQPTRPLRPAARREDRTRDGVPPQDRSMTAPTPRFRKLPPRYNAVALPLVLSVVMTLIVSGISTLTALGFSAGFLHAWLMSWGLSWATAFPILLAVLPLAPRIVAMLVAAP